MRRGSRADKELKTRVVMEYMQGVPPRELAKRYDIHPYTPAAWARQLAGGRNPIRPRPHRVYPLAVRLEAWRRWREGERAAVIARELGCSRETVLRWVSELEEEQVRAVHSGRPQPVAAE